MKEIDTNIYYDLFRYYGDKPTNWIQRKRLYGWQYMKSWRKANYYLRKNNILYYLYGWLLYRKSIKYGFQISPQASIGKGLYLGHFGTIVVGNEVKIGNNCNLSPNVVIGRCNRGKLTGSPELGNKVWVGSGAVIVGNVKIGSNVLIAPNSYVNFDVPDNSIVIGNPATVHKSEGATNGYIDNIKESD